MKQTEIFRTRASGVLLPVFSLPSPYGIGNLGAAARRWIDWLAAAGQTYWQVLPVGVTGYGDSPYQASDACAGNPYLIDPDELVEAGFLTEEDLISSRAANTGYVDYGALWSRRYGVLLRAFRASGAYAPPERSRVAAAFSAWCAEQRGWAEDYARFMTLKAHFGQRAWSEWEDWAKNRRGAAWERFDEAQMIGEKRVSEEIVFYLWLQFEFDRQWQTMRAYANERGVRLIGDMPIYCAFDSADVWAHPEYFRLRDGAATAVAGVPPDYFSEKGQVWGNPLYDWDYHRAHGYDWWIARMRRNLALFDGVRIDHFRGFSAFYVVPAGDGDARRGHWETGPGSELFDRMREALGELPILAEDLGLIDDGVRALLRDTGFPGMKVLQFAFDGNPLNDYLPARHVRHCVLYTGTHDNATLAEWAAELSAETRRVVRRALGGAPNAGIPSLMMRAAEESVADTVVLCAQDLLGLGGEARLNTPAVAEGNWRWRLTELPSAAVCRRLRTLTERAGRLSVPPNEAARE